MENNTNEYILLTNIEQKTEVMSHSSCLLLLNAMSMSLAVDACRVSKYFELLLEQWQECLPLGDAYDVNFSVWGNKIWEMMQKVRYAYSLNNVPLNIYVYHAESYLDFKEKQETVGPVDDSLLPLQQLNGREVADIVMCALRELSEVLMEISEFLNSPTEEQIAQSYDKWLACYKKHYQRKCRAAYNKWKIGFSSRTLKNRLQARMKNELEDFRSIFLNDDEFEQVYDAEQKTIDYDGLSRFLFTHADRFGVSHIDPRPMFSQELLTLFNMVETWRQMQSDLQPKKRPAEKAEAAPVVDDLEQKVSSLIAKIQHLVAEDWSQHLTTLWKHIYTNFRSEISRAGSREKFKEFSKKTLYCIIGHLKTKGVYQEEVTVLELTKLLEGVNNGMRKYLNNGLMELDQSLSVRIKSFVEQEMERLVPKV